MALKKLIDCIEIVVSLALAFIGIAFIVMYVSGTLHAEPVMPPMSGDPGTSGVNNNNSGLISQVGNYNEASSSIAPGAVSVTNNIAGTVPGNTFGNAQNDNSSGSTANLRLNNVGSSNFRYPVQPPPVVGYGSYSQASCMGSFGASGSGGAGGGGLLLPWESDDCNYRLNSAHMAALGKPKTACYIMTDNIDYVGDANKKAPDESCANVIATSVAMPVPGAIVNQSTPTLDAAMPPHEHPDMASKKDLDNAHKYWMSK